MTAYDVSLSFAGDDRTYVRSVAAYLRDLDIHVFFDEYETVNLWGKDLYQHLAEVYRSAKYCVVFISKAYADKVWTRHELKSAQARAYQAQHEYILPARFDDTQLPGVLSTTMYLDLREISPEALGRLIVEKLRSGELTAPIVDEDQAISILPHDPGPRHVGPTTEQRLLDSIRFRMSEPLDAVETYHSTVDRLVHAGRWSYSHEVAYPRELIEAEEVLEQTVRMFSRDINVAWKEAEKMLLACAPNVGSAEAAAFQHMQAIYTALGVVAVTIERATVGLTYPIRRGLTIEQLRTEELYTTISKWLNAVVDAIRAARAAGSYGRRAEP